MFRQLKLQSCDCYCDEGLEGIIIWERFSIPPSAVPLLPPTGFNSTERKAWPCPGGFPPVHFWVEYALEVAARLHVPILEQILHSLPHGPGSHHHNILRHECRDDHIPVRLQRFLDPDGLQYNDR
jgi:hypothetical protein